MTQTIRQQTAIRNALLTKAERDLDDVPAIYVVAATLCAAVLLGVVIYHFWSAFA